MSFNYVLTALHTAYCEVAHRRLKLLEERIWSKVVAVLHCEASYVVIFGYSRTWVLQIQIIWRLNFTTFLLILPLGAGLARGSLLQATRTVL